jgi:hypothetical protein
MAGGVGCHFDHPVWGVRLAEVQGGAVKYWITRYTELWLAPRASGERACYLPVGAVVNDLNEKEGDFCKVLYVASKPYTGWMNSRYMEAVCEIMPVGVVDMGHLQTINEQDAAQYVVWMDNVQYNLCGEMCICYAFDEPLLGLLDSWRAKSTGAFNRVFLGGKSRPTGVNDLQEMASLYSAEFMPLRMVMTDNLTRQILFTPGRLANCITDGYMPVVGVKIEGVRGELRSTGIPHWVAVKSVAPTGVNKGLVTIYNPFGNQIEQYDWHCFSQSVGVPFGLLVRP